MIRRKSSSTPTESKDEERVIADNQGKGSCAFYALANGVLRLLRDEIITGKADQPGALFQKLIPLSLLSPISDDPVAEKRRADSLAIYKAELVKDIMCYQYKSKFRNPMELPRAYLRKGVSQVVEYFRPGDKSTTGLSKTAAVGIDPFLHKADKLFRQMIVSKQKGDLSAALENKDARLKVLKDNPLFEQIIPVFNAYYRGDPRGLYIPETLEHGPLLKQIIKCAKEYKRIGGHYPAGEDMNNAQIQDAALDFLTAYICNPSQIQSMRTAIKEQSYDPKQKQFELEESSVATQLYEKKKILTNYGENSDLTILGKLLGVSISCEKKDEFKQDVMQTDKLSEGFTHQITLHFKKGLIALTNHWNTFVSAKEFKEGEERGYLFGKFSKYTDFSKYPQITPEEITAILEKGVASTVKVSLFASKQDKAVLGQLKTLAKEGDIGKLMDFIEKNNKGLSSQLSSALKFIKLRVEDSQRHPEYRRELVQTSKAVIKPA